MLEQTNFKHFRSFLNIALNYGKCWMLSWSLIRNIIKKSPERFCLRAPAPAVKTGFYRLCSTRAGGQSVQVPYKISCPSWNNYSCVTHNSCCYILLLNKKTLWINLSNCIETVYGEPIVFWFSVAPSNTFLGASHQ
jgi:hypothetical protein